MGIETLPEPSNPLKKSGFGDRVSSGYVGWVDSGVFGSNFWLFGYGRVLLTPKHETIIVKEKSNLYLRV